MNIESGLNSVYCFRKTLLWKLADLQRQAVTISALAMVIKLNY